MKIKYLGTAAYEGFQDYFVNVRLVKKQMQRVERIFVYVQV